MADESTPGVLLKGEEGHYFIPHAELGKFAVPGDADPEGKVSQQAPRVEAFSVQRTSVESDDVGAGGFVVLAQENTARILAAAND
ncbi:MAG TPA: hypothetical protein VJ814_00510 [Gaiellaceae bacterium]|nr:hypothetical protein [Gaiellaceae bacterium]